MGLEVVDLEMRHRVGHRRGANRRRHGTRHADRLAAGDGAGEHDLFADRRQVGVDRSIDVRAQRVLDGDPHAAKHDQVGLDRLHDAISGGPDLRPEAVLDVPSRVSAPA